jgi:hypothetical protein
LLNSTLIDPLAEFPHRLGGLPIFQNARFQPAPDQIDYARITAPVFDKPEHPFVIEAPEEVLQIRLQHPPDHAASNGLIEGCQGTMGTAARSTAGKSRQKSALQRPHPALILVQTVTGFQVVSVHSIEVVSAIGAPVDVTNHSTQEGGYRSSVRRRRP